MYIKNMLTATNTTSHFLFTTDSGDTFADKARDTLGGFDNMLKRISIRLGESRCVVVMDDPTAPATSTLHIETRPSAIRVDFMEVSKL